MSDESTEQTTEATPSDAEHGTAATREELIAAVRAAGGTESADASGESVAAPVAVVEPIAAEEEPKIAALLRAREKATAEREAGRNHAQEMIETARKEAAQLLEEARAKATKAWEEELANKRKQFEASPAEVVRQLAGGDTQRFVDGVLRDGSPEARALAEITRKLAETEKVAGEGAAARKEIQELRDEVAKRNHEQLIANVRSEFLGSHATPEKTPYAHAEYGGEDGVFHRADQKAAEWQRQGLVLRKDFDFADVAQYLEIEAKKSFEQKLKVLGLTPAQPVSAGAPVKEPGIAPKVPANGPRTLSAASSSERRTSPKPLAQMSPAEARDALIAEVAAARRANPDSVM